jgi:hypothetical protein
MVLFSLARETGAGKQGVGHGFSRADRRTDQEGFRPGSSQKVLFQ